MVTFFQIFPCDSNVQPELRTTALEKTQWVLCKPCQVGCFFSPKAKRVHRDLLLARMVDEQVGGGGWLKELRDRTSLVAQWLRIRLPMQGTLVRALVQEDPTCRRATKPMRHSN